MRKETKKEIINYGCLAIGMVTFIAIHLLWMNTLLWKDMFFSLLESTEDVWWNETLIAGTMGWIGVGGMAMFLYPAPLSGLVAYKISKDYLNKKCLKNVKGEEK